MSQPRRHRASFAAVVALLAGAPAANAAAPADPPSPRTLRTNLPLAVVDTRGHIPNEPKVRGSLRIVDNARGLRNRVGDEPVFRGGMGIEVRGFSSRVHAKKQYAIELDRDAALLGLPADDDWVLAAPYSDKSLMRNVLAHHTARALGRYAPHTRFVELVLNGNYRGVYVLTQRIELGKGRVEVDEDGVSGGYILELTTREQARGERLFMSPITSRPFLFTDPNRDDLSAREAGWIRGYIGRFERALYRGGNWRRHLDVPAAVDFVLLQELFKNADGFFSSTYMHKGRGAKLALGPVWDFDRAMGNSDYGASSRLPGLMVANRTWVERLYLDRGFTRAMARRWRELRRAGLRRDVMRSIAAMSAQLAGPAARNFQRWPILGKYVTPNPRDPRTGGYRTTWHAEVRFLRGWLNRRIAWLDRGLPLLAR
jgi:CotH kinase protein